MASRTVRKVSSNKKPTAKTNSFSEVVDVPIMELKPHPKNPRQGNVDLVVESLKAYGQYRPIVVNARNNIIATGHHSWLAARKLGWETISVAYIDVDEETHRRIMLADNKTGNVGGYDEKMLAELIDSIEDTTAIGYSDSEIEDIMAYTESIAKSATDSAKQQINEVAGERNKNTVAGSALGDEPDEEDEDTGPTLEDAEMDLPGALQLKDPYTMEYANAPGLKPWGIPALLDGCFMKWEDINPNLDSWGGSACKNWEIEDQQWLYNWGIDSTSGMKDISNVIIAFYCVDEDTEALTQRGWLKGDEITEDDLVLSMDPETHDMRWSSIKTIFRKQYTGKMHHLTSNAMDALVTPNHSFLTQRGLVKVEDINETHRIHLIGNAEPNNHSIYTDAFVELVGWAITEGHYSFYEKKNGDHTNYVTISQKTDKPEVDRIRTVIKSSGGEWTESYSGTNCTSFKVKKVLADELFAVSPNRIPTNDFLLSLNPFQRELLINTMLDGDGSRTETADTYCQKDKKQIDFFVALCAMSGKGTNVHKRRIQSNLNGYAIDSEVYYVNVLKRKNTQVQDGVNFHGGFRDKRIHLANVPTVDYTGLVWCPSTEYGTFVCRRNDKVFVTGNTFDQYFEKWWDRASIYCSKVLNSGIKYAISPNFSQWMESPRAINIYELYRSRYLARYFQEVGLKVCVDILWPLGDFEFLDTITLATLPKNIPMISMEMQTTAKDVAGMDQYKKEYQHVFDTLKPGGMILYAGKPGREWFEANINPGCPVAMVGTRNEKLSIQAQKREKKTTI